MTSPKPEEPLPLPLTDEQLAGQQMDWLDGEADAWAERISLHRMTEGMVAPMQWQLSP